MRSAGENHHGLRTARQFVNSAKVHRLNFQVRLGDVSGPWSRGAFSDLPVSSEQAGVLLFSGLDHVLVIEAVDLQVGCSEDFLLLGD